MVPPKPSLHLLRSLTDEHVLRALMAGGQSTRAELAVRTQLSKPTVSDSVRRLTESGLLIDSGERSSGRGRSGSYYRLAQDAGSALVVGLAPAGITAEIVDPYGNTTAHTAAGVQRPAVPEDVSRILGEVVTEILGTVSGPVRIAVVSAADPVHRGTGHLVHLPDAPFLLGELSPGRIIAPLIDGGVVVDNDVNWAALAERHLATETGTALDDFVYVYLGAGLGSAVVSDGEIRRGHAGLAGELAHLVTTGPAGQAIAFIDVFGELGLRRTGSTAIDESALLAAAIGSGDDDADHVSAVRACIGRAVCGVLAACVALTDPEVIIIGGTWGRHPAVLAAIRHEFDQHPRHVPVREAKIAGEPSLAGARTQALEDLRAAIIGEAVRRSSHLPGPGVHELR